MLAFLRLPRVLEARGTSRSKFYLDISERLFTRPIKPGEGGRLAIWPSYEVEALNAADLAGASRDEIKKLVAHLEAARTGPDPEAGAKRLLADMLAARKSTA